MYIHTTATRYSEATVWENRLRTMRVTKVPDRRVACRPGRSSLDAVFTIGGV
jgi:hypothetical protein